MASQVGVVLHPQLDAEIKAYPGGRVYLVRHLRRMADEANAAGDLKTKAGDYDAAQRLWACSARYIRASQSVGFGISTNPEDYDIIGVAWRRAVEQNTREKVKEK